MADHMQAPISGPDVPQCWTLLDDRSRRVAEVLTAALPAPVHELDVSVARALTATEPGEAPLTTIDHVETIRIPTRAGDVGGRLYRHAESDQSGALLYFHGGGWVMGTLDGVDELCRAIAKQSGVSVISVDYRLAPEHPYPAALNDTVDAFEWLVQSGRALGIDPSAIAVGGDSAGGNLAAALCLVMRGRSGPAPVAQVLAYPAVDNRFERDSWTTFADAPLLTTDAAKWCYRQYAQGAFRSTADPYLAPVRAESLRELPPALVITAEVDPLRDDADAFASRLAADGVDVTSMRYPGVFHGFFPEVDQFTQSREAIEAVCAFLGRIIS